MKKILLSISCLCAATIMNAQNVNIPDAVFKAYLVARTDINTNSDAEIQVTEATAYNGFIAINHISDLTGIASFVNLTNLVCNTGSITTLDLSANTALQYIQCQQNKLTSLILPASNTLLQLSCFSNSLTTLNLSANTALTNLRCEQNYSLTTLNVSANTALKVLWCSYNNLSTLSVTTNTALTDLDCSWNNLTTLNVSANTLLNTLTCYGNKLPTLNVSSNPNLGFLYCDANKLTALNVATNTGLHELTCTSNSLTVLSVSTNSVLNMLRCDANQLSALSLANNPNLNTLTFNHNMLSAITVTANIYLKYLDCSYNQLSALDLTAQSLSPTNGLTNMNCTNNALLSCIQVTNVATASAKTNWLKDATANYNTNCSASAGMFESANGTVNNVSIYPNPTTGIINITLATELVTEALEVTITNALGQIVLTEVSNSNNITLKTDNLITGMYFVNVTDSKGNKAVQKIIKQ